MNQDEKQIRRKLIVSILVFGLIIFNLADYFLTSIWYPLTPEHEANPLARASLDSSKRTLFAFVKLIVFPFVLYGLWRLLMKSYIPYMVVLIWCFFFLIMAHQIVIQTYHIGYLWGWW